MQNDTDFEVDERGGTWVGPYGEVYVKDSYGFLTVGLPDYSMVVLNDFENGDMGIFLPGFEMDPGDWDYSTFIVSNIADLEEGIGPGYQVDVMASQLRFLEGRFDSLYTPGPTLYPEMPTIG